MNTKIKEVEVPVYINCSFCGQLNSEQSDKCDYCGRCLRCSE